MTTTQTTKRTDIHAPASESFDPEAYYFVFFVDLHTEDGNRREMYDVVKPLFANGHKRGPHWGQSQCGHCGSHLRYAAVAVHETTKDIILIGESCLENRFELTKSEFDSLRRAGKLNAERRTRNERIAALLDNHPDLVWLTYFYNISELSWSGFLGSVYRAFMVDGRMTDKQIYRGIDAFFNLSDRHWDKVAEDARRAAESANYGPIGTVGEKITVVGKVTHIFAGTPAHYYAATPYAYIIETADGIVKTTSTASKTFDDVERGDVVKVTGTVREHSEYKGTVQTIVTRPKCERLSGAL